MRHSCAGPDSKPWAATGTVVKLDESSEEVALELKGGAKVRPRALCSARCAPPQPWGFRAAVKKS